MGSWKDPTHEVFTGSGVCSQQVLALLGPQNRWLQTEQVPM